ncbi:unnamed protein product [Rotaria magnacalcarata]|uniref:Uncharacterized protein n=1 Tax=Rotaria magnacalcarata TaxID=392030 RepID=A0A8S3H3M5_9BILA|nr:unnamed protein product [Rotaria magnacalcarata]
MLIDTGSSLRVINSYLLSQLDPYIKKYFRPPPTNIHLQLAKKSPLLISYTLNVPINYQLIPQIANGVLSPAKNLCIQAANLSKTTITILVDQKLATISRKNIKQLNAINHLAKTNVKEAPDTRDDNIINLSNTDISNDQKTQLQQLVKKYPDVFTNKSSRTSKLKHQLKIKEGTQPINAPPY